MRGTRASFSVAAAAACIAFGVMPAAAGASSFGANLNRPANSSFDCTVVPPFSISTGVGTCTWWTTGTIAGNVSETLVVPATGVVTRARVKVGPTTGQMQIVALRAIRHPNSLAFPGCCFYVGESQVFTPAANAITTVDLNIPVKNEIDEASGLANYDTLALSVLEPGVPVPVHATGDYAMGPSSGALYPHMQTGQERADVAGLTGFQVLMNADFQAAPGAGGGSGGVPTPGVVGNPIALAAKTARMRRGSVAVPLVCRLTTLCDGVLRLRGGAGAATAARAKAVTYATKRFKIAAGKTAKLKLRLSKRAKRIVRKRNKLRVTAVMTLGAGASKQTVRSSLKLR